MMLLGRGWYASKTTNARKKVVNLEIRYRKAKTHKSVLRCAQYAKRFEVWPWKTCGGDEIRNQFGNYVNLEINVLPYVFLIQVLHMPRSNNSCGVYRPKYQKLRILARLAQPTYPIPARCGTDTAGRGAFEPPTESGPWTKLFDREFQFRESHTEPETKKLLTESPPKRMIIYIYIYRCPHLLTPPIPSHPTPTPSNTPPSTHWLYDLQYIHDKLVHYFQNRHIYHLKRMYSFHAQIELPHPPQPPPPHLW